MFEVAILVVGAVGVVVSLATVGWRTTVTWVVLFSLCVAPVTLARMSDTAYNGIGGAAPTLTSFAIVLLIVGAISAFTGRVSWLALLFIPLVLYCAYGMAFLWDADAMNWAGIEQYVLGVAAFATVGLLIRTSGDRRSELLRHTAYIVAFIIFMQAGLTVLQWAGFDFNPVSARSAEFLEGRFNGSLDHPNTLGKVLVLLMAVLLPLTRQQDRQTRRIANIGLIAAMLPLALTGGRANFAAALMMIVIWALLLPRSRALGARVLLPAGVLVVSIAFLGYFLERLAEDPAGGSRERLHIVANYQISLTPWTGVGPNAYVDAAGQYDSLTAAGLPVHNSFLLTVAEIGFVGAAFLFLPFLVAIVRALIHIRRKDESAAGARALFALAPGLLLIATTGWGMVAGAVFPLWCLTFGFLSLVRVDEFAGNLTGDQLHGGTLARPAALRSRGATWA